MKYFTCIFSLLFLLLSSVVSAGLVSWSKQFVSPSRYLSTPVKPNINIEDYGRGRYPLKIKLIRVTPDNAKPGDELDIVALGYLSEIVDRGAIVKVHVRVGSENPVRKVYDLCGMLNDNSNKIDLACPIQKGDINIFQKVKLPKDIPEKMVNIMVTAYTRNGALLARFRITADFSSSGFNEYLELGN